MYLQRSCEADWTNRTTKPLLLKHGNLSPRKTSSQNAMAIFELVLSQQAKPISMKKTGTAYEPNQSYLGHIPNRKYKRGFLQPKANRWLRGFY